MHDLVIDNATTVAAAQEFTRRWCSRHHGALEVWGDSSGKARSTRAHGSDYQIIEDTLRPAFSGLQMRVWTFNLPVRERVNAVNARLCNARNERQIRIAPECKNLINDFEQVQWSKQETLDHGADSRLTHVSDALGYYIVRRWPVTRKLRVI